MSNHYAETQEDLRAHVEDREWLDQGRHDSYPDKRVYEEPCGGCGRNMLMFIAFAPWLCGGCHKARGGVQGKDGRWTYGPVKAG